MAISPLVLPIRSYYRTLKASTGISFETSAALFQQQYRISPLVLPIRSYISSDKQPNAQGRETISFSASAMPVGGGGLNPKKIVGDTTIEVIGPAVIWLVGKGALQASISIDFALVADTNVRAAMAAESIDFSQVATLAASGALRASETLAFSAAPTVLSSPLKAVTALSFAATAEITPIGRLQASTSIVFENPGQLFRSISAATAIAFDATAELFGELGEAFQWFIDVRADPWAIPIVASDWTIAVPATDWYITVADDRFILTVEPRDNEVKAA